MFQLQVPKNVRMKMMNKMDIDDRCRMTRCSKLCNQEVRCSKNFSVQLKFKKTDDNSMRIRVSYTEGNRTHGYYINFTRLIKSMSYYTLDNTRVWEMQLINPTDFDQFVIEKFRRTLKYYQNNINKLLIHFTGDENSEMWMNVDFGIESLENLEDLSVYAPVDVQQFFSKIHHPLKSLSLGAKWNTPTSANYNQICRVERRLSSFTLSLNYQQLLQLSANEIAIGIGQLTERNIFNFIRSWQDGSQGREISSYGWLLRNTNFDRRKLLRLLRVPNRETDCIEIKHFNNPGKSAYLHHQPFLLTFST